MRTTLIAGFVVVIILIQWTESKISGEDAEIIFFRINFKKILGLDDIGYVPWDNPDDDNIRDTLITRVGIKGTTLELDPNLQPATVLERHISRKTERKKLWVQKATFGNLTYYLRKDPQRYHLFIFKQHESYTQNQILSVEGYVPTYYRRKLRNLDSK